MVNLFVPLTRAEIDKLIDIAQAERRHPKEQAAWMLAKAIAEATKDPAAHPRPPK